MGILGSQKAAEPRHGGRAPPPSPADRQAVAAGLRPVQAHHRVRDTLRPHPDGCGSPARCIQSDVRPCATRARNWPARHGRRPLSESTRIWADSEAQLHLADRCMVPFPTAKPICAPVRPGALPGSGRHHPGTGIPAHLGAAVIYPERPLPSAGIRALMPCSRGRLFQVRTWRSLVDKGDARLPGMRHNQVC